MRFRFFSTILILQLSIFSTAQNKECLCSLVEQSEETVKKIIDLGTEIEESLNQLSTEKFDKNFNTEAFIKNIYKDDSINPNDPFVKGFVEGLSNSAKTLSKNFVEEIEAGSYYNFYNYEYNVPEQAYFMSFRIYSEETGVNYHDYKVCSDGEKLMFNDIYIYLSGEDLSQTFRRILKAAAPKENEKSPLFKKEDGFPILKITSAQKLYQSGLYKSAYNMISKIEGDFANEKFFLILKANIASAYDADIYEKELENFAKLYPNDPTLYMKQIDYYLIKENYNKAIENIDKLMFETDDDFLNLLKANVYLIKQDYKNADSHFAYMIENYPNLAEGYIGLISSFTYQSQFDNAVEIIEKLIAEGFEKAALTEFLESVDEQGDNVLKSLIVSEAYTNWKYN
ncbi:tetratricopeptide repeat protein [Winogradskyella litorisediminis]|uniref:Tetratricopeptide repeat protein n=1 Tax=Winogradskyella litorisediminis TaxID=1156618 RepID=A0ABW3ND49_9FLAO